MRIITGVVVLSVLWWQPANAGELEARIESLLEGPTSRARRIEISDRSAIIGIEVARRIPLDDLLPEIENRYEVVVGALAAMRPEVDAVHLLVAHPGEPLRPPPRSRFDERPPVQRSVVRDPSRFPFGQSLAGRVVAISSGHGYIYYDNLGRYSTQRGNVKWNGCGTCRGIVEDFETHEIVVRHLVPLLEGAGARVILVRERDENTFGAIVDDGAAQYAETSTFTTGTSAGGHDGDYRVSDALDAAATFTIVPPNSGAQLLSLWFVAGANRHDAARLTVRAANAHHFLVDMQSHGGRWAPISTFYFEAGVPVSVTLEAPVAPTAGRFLIADAMRTGAGVHAESGRAWWLMGAKPYAAYQNAPAAIQSRGDVTTRPRYAEHFGADIYVALHSNASGQPDSTAAGTATYRYNCGSFPDHSSDPPATDCDDPTGSDRLQRLVHDRLVGELRAQWDPNWRDRGTKVANFGEMRDLEGIPGTLIESAFHDNVRLPDGSDLRATDNQSLHDPRWRRAAAFGIYRGISEYFDEAAPLVAPPPTHLALRRVNASSVELSFQADVDAMSHRVYLATDGRQFDEGRIVEGNTVRLDGLNADAIVSVRVASLNAAGEGPTGGVVSARPSARRAQLLIIDAFEREDAWVQSIDNRHDTAMTHALALSGVAHAFDAADEAAIRAGLVDVTNYDGVIVALGRESTADAVVTATIRAALSSVVASGGALFMSGSEVAWALDNRGDDESRTFLSEQFGVSFGADDAAAMTVQPVTGGWFEGAPIMLADETTGLLSAKFSDVFTLGSDAVAELTYAAGNDVAGARRGNNVVLGVALDSLVGADRRAAILGAWADAAVELAPVDPVVDAGVVDAGTVDGGNVDGGPPDPDAGADDGGATVDAFVGLRSDAKDPIQGDCGCTAANRGGRCTWLLLAVLVLIGRRRR